MSRPVIAYLGIGSNLGDPIENCRTALREIASLKNVQVLRRLRPSTGLNPSETGRSNPS